MNLHHKVQDAKVGCGKAERHKIKLEIIYFEMMLEVSVLVTAKQ
jgi:hypothetical protein